MLNFFISTPLNKLNKRYRALLKQAMVAQRAGDILLYSKLRGEAEKALIEIERLIERNRATQP